MNIVLAFPLSQVACSINQRMSELTYEHPYFSDITTLYSRCILDFFLKVRYKERFLRQKACMSMKIHSLHLDENTPLQSSISTGSNMSMKMHSVHLDGNTPLQSSISTASTHRNTNLSIGFPPALLLHIPNG